ncbi:FIST signal transduction protein [Balneatrix alpica]|uniref:FIST signal transduction protein n=1 Tax=Balneatrix alpica TaxID=75684 RepID=A0ABV5ZGN7_9GAMM|nr:FIST N-terminal domain-containing protein [Balneatrix alpica]
MHTEVIHIPAKARQQPWLLPELAAAQLVLVFMDSHWLAHWAECYQRLHQRYPQAEIVGCSSAGEIYADQVSCGDLVAIVIHFQHTPLRVALARLQGRSSDALGAELGQSLLAEDLRHVLVFSEGLHINGSLLAQSLRQQLGQQCAVTGGLAGDGERFAHTWVCLNEHCYQDAVVAVGLYGQALHVGMGSQGGWDSFGPDRLITKAQGAELFELDGQSALALYKTYLGEHASGLPATGLLFPLSVKAGQGEAELVRTILAVNEEHGSIIFAGEMPEGCYARLMKANFECLVDGAQGAANLSLAAMQSQPGLALLISCVGRRLVLGHRIEEEVEAVRDVLGPATLTAGFYSYGEIAPQHPQWGCELHNQTMTITLLQEWPLDA